jgi:hypothetical protein
MCVFCCSGATGRNVPMSSNHIKYLPEIYCYFDLFRFRWLIRAYSTSACASCHEDHVHSLDGLFRHRSWSSRSWWGSRRANCWLGKGMKRTWPSMFSCKESACPRIAHIFRSLLETHLSSEAESCKICSMLIVLKKRESWRPNGQTDSRQQCLPWHPTLVPSSFWGRIRAWCTPPCTASWVAWTLLGNWIDGKIWNVISYL